MEIDTGRGEIEFNSISSRHIARLLPDKQGEIEVGRDRYTCGPYAHDFSYRRGSFEVITEYSLRFGDYEPIKGFIVSITDHDGGGLYWLSEEGFLEIILETRGSFAYFIEQKVPERKLLGYRVVVSSGEESVILRLEEISEYSLYPGAGFMGALSFGKGELDLGRLQEMIHIIEENVRSSIESEVLEAVFRYDLRALFQGIMLKGQLTQG